MSLLDRYLDSPLKSAAVSGHGDVVEMLARYAKARPRCSHGSECLFVMGLDLIKSV